MSRDPSSLEIAQSTIRNKPNPLQVDPDVEEDVLYRTTPAPKVTEAQWRTCAAIYSEHYGVWGPRAHEMWPSVRAVPGRKIVLSPEGLKARCLTDGANNILITAMTKAGTQIGHCCVSQWMHEGDRVWWITQLVVCEKYRDQRRATRMLQALVKHYNIGKNSSRKDFVGVLSPHPFAICAVLRVFGRGIESFSGPNSERTSLLRAAQCTELLRGSPVGWLREAKLDATSVAVNTKCFVDQAVPKEALRRISYAINKQLREPWGWPFGELPEGYECICVLEYRWNPRNTMRPQLCQELTDPSTPAGMPRVKLSSTQKPVDYAVINELLVRMQDNDASSDSSEPGDDEDDARIVRAIEALEDCGDVIASTMDGKRIPQSIPPLYALRYSDVSLVPSPEWVSTWLDMKLFAQNMHGAARYMRTRLALLQAIHFEVVTAQCEELRKEKEKEKAEPRQGKKGRKTQRDGWATEGPAVVDQGAWVDITPVETEKLDVPKKQACGAQPTRDEVPREAVHRLSERRAGTENYGLPSRSMRHSRIPHPTKYGAKSLAT